MSCLAVETVLIIKNCNYKIQLKNRHLRSQFHI